MLHGFQMIGHLKYEPSEWPWLAMEVRGQRGLSAQRKHIPGHHGVATETYNLLDESNILMQTYIRTNSNYRRGFYMEDLLQK